MANEPNRPSVELGPEGGTISSGPRNSPAAEWGGVFERFNLDPALFEIVDDTVRMSSWECGSETLYSYRARFRRVATDEHAVSDRQFRYWRDRIRGTDGPAALPGQAGESGYVIAIGDSQLGKRGTEESVENWRRGLQRHIDTIDELGHIEEITVAFQGDEIENVSGHYANQLHTVELNLTRQLELDFELRMWTLSELVKLGVPLRVSSVISNHGELSRLGGGRNQTSQSDNASTMVARMVRRAFEDTGHQVEWHIADGEPHVTFETAGVPMYFSHGHIARGRGQTAEQRTKNALERQMLGRPELLATKLFVVSHYHHAYMQEFEGRTLFGCPALEAERSSAYMLDNFGVWSPPGMLGVEVGTRHGSRGYGALRIF